jgi:hypothetical protein
MGKAEHAHHECLTYSMMGTGVPFAHPTMAPKYVKLADRQHLKALPIGEFYP